MKLVYTDIKKMQQYLCLVLSNLNGPGANIKFKNKSGYIMLPKNCMVNQK